MNTSRVTTTVALALTLLAGPLLAQMPEAAIQEEFDRISESVIRIRTIADLDFQTPAHAGSGATSAVNPYSVDGTGVVVGTTVVDGRTEYLILTNHHVADASNYVMEEGGYLRVNPTNTLAVPSVPETSYLLAGEGEEIGDDAIELVEVIRRVRGDMTLMRTVGADRALVVFDGQIGFVEGEIATGAPVVTSGYPWGGGKIAALGSIAEVGYAHQLGLPHEDFVLDLPVEPGQSGGPIFLVEGQDEQVTFRLVGLVHAKDRERNYGVPYDLWADSLDEFPAELQARLVR